MAVYQVRGPLLVMVPDWFPVFNKTAWMHDLLQHETGQPDNHPAKLQL